MHSLNQNSFHFMRFVAASLVLVSHHYPLSGAREPVVPIIGNTWGGLAVSVFFIMSGFLIFQSLQRSTSFTKYISSRVLRLVPNLIFALVLSSAAMLVWFSNYDHISSHLRYVIFNSTVYLHEVLYKIPGVLNERPNQAINGSLWTLQYEFFMYCVLFVVFLLPRKLIVPSVLIALFGFSAFAFFGSKEVVYQLLTFKLIENRMGILGMNFMTGALCAALWPLVMSNRISAAIVGILATASAAIIGQDNILFSLGLGLAILLICDSKIFANFEKGGDASYGIYIFAFPVQQLAIIGIDGFFSSLAAAFFITVLLGYATWHTFEKRCLDYRQVVVSLLARSYAKLPHAWWTVPQESSSSSTKQE